MGRSREEKKNEWVTHTNTKILLREREREREKEKCVKKEETCPGGDKNRKVQRPLQMAIKKRAKEKDR
jgi:hypothetical protein